MKNQTRKTINLLMPVVLGGGILYWMYRDSDFTAMKDTLLNGMNWGWMLFSLIFGVSAQVIRGIRWKMTLKPIGENPRTMDCIHAIFLSYASSLIVPRSGEITRCGVLSRYDGTSFTKGIGTVVTERIIDSLLLALIAAIVMLAQVGVFTHFFRETGTSFTDILRSFSGTGYFVTALCIIITIVTAYFYVRRFGINTKLKTTLNNLKEGVSSLHGVEHKWLFAAYTLGIWLSYFLHYWITFNCFSFTEDLSFTVAIVSFIVGSISVIVPTPNGAGPWHFAVKTILILYGLKANDAVTFVLIVHTVQTALIPLLGIFSAICLMRRVKSEE